MSSATDPKPLSAPAERPLPSDRFDAAQARLQADAASAPVKAKRSKNPAYYVLRYDADLSAWEPLTDRPVAATSRKDAISKVAPVAPLADGAAPERFVAILADAWTEITRSVKPRQEYEEVWE